MSEKPSPTSGEIRWLTPRMARAIHQKALSRFGGASGVRDPKLIESALARPQNQFHYGTARTWAQLAAALGYGLAQNHPFIDGNKRVAAIAMGAFLYLNGIELIADEAELVRIMEEVSSSKLSEEELARWIKTTLDQAEP